MGLQGLRRGDTAASHVLLPQARLSAGFDDLVRSGADRVRPGKSDRMSFEVIIHS